ncbi:hypothetical protein JKF63_04077 [Porcisia hertigi]|uniref:DNA polymerase sigma-like protein n=1 Tax=Porcisia hertigi TaxID=2761500 RepID=A0A836ISE0_9TRYP|nr:hypothetical protein JKF63_04077 [Porcisia hertigi]
MNLGEFASLERAVERTITHQSRSGVSKLHMMRSHASRPTSERHLTPSSSGVPDPLVSSSTGNKTSPHSPHYKYPHHMSAVPGKSHASTGGTCSVATRSHRERTHHPDRSVQMVAGTAGRSSSRPTDLGAGRATSWRSPPMPHPEQGDAHSVHSRNAPQSPADHHNGRRRREGGHCIDDEDDCPSYHRKTRRPRIEPSVRLTAEAPEPAHLSSSPGISFEAVKSLLPVSSDVRCILAFDAKLIELLYCLSPTSEERETKLRVIDDIRTTMQRTGIDIQIYGSLCTGLVIPASDVDCVLMRSGNEEIASVMAESLSFALLNIASATNGLASQKSIKGSLSTAVRTVADRMRRSHHFTNITSIAHAKVPIVKCRHRRNGVRVDLSFEQSGCVSSNYLCQQFCELGNEMARPLIVLVKALVNNCRLDDPSIGGLGSFPISLLVLWYLRQCVRTRFAAELQKSIGALLTGFLKYYGSEFDFRRLGIDYVQQKTFTKAPANDLYIVNPVCPGTNCAKAATLFATRVVPLFQRAAATFVELLDTNAPSATMEARLLGYYSSAASGVQNWTDVSRRAAREPHLQQNMWDAETNMYVGGVL